MGGLVTALMRLSIPGPNLSCSLNLKSKVPPYFAYESERRDVAKRQKQPEVPFWAECGVPQAGDVSQSDTIKI
jgi:hypothetical protein